MKGHSFHGVISDAASNLLWHFVSELNQATATFFASDGLKKPILSIVEFLSLRVVIFVLFLVIKPSASVSWSSHSKYLEKPLNYGNILHSRWTV